MPGKAADLEAEMLAALVATIAVLPARADRIAARLLWPAARAAHRLVERERAWRAWEEPRASLPAPARSLAHPDLVLAQAVAEGVISARNAELVAETRIGGVPLRELARRWDVSYKALCRRRERCEPALVAWLLARQMSPNRP
jgi:hypothetical protein